MEKQHAHGLRKAGGAYTGVLFFVFFCLRFAGDMVTGPGVFRTYTGLRGPIPFSVYLAPTVGFHS